MSFLDQITPLLITYNEAPNIERTLGALAWAREIVVVDSGSDDGTLEILARDPRIRVLDRPFDSFAAQCNFGLDQGGISTEWVLSLDADQIISPELVAELEALELEPETSAYECGFDWSVFGRRLRGAVYPPRVVLFRLLGARFEDLGHGHRAVTHGKTERLRGRIVHDDRKSVGRWIDGQVGYSRAEAKKLTAGPAGDLSAADRVRKLGVLAPFAALFTCLILRRGILDGWAGWHYAFQRMTYETILSLRLLEAKLRRREAEKTNQTEPTP